MKPPSILLEKKHWRPSSYATYSNLLFMHVHAGLSLRELPLNFQNGLLLAVQREGLDYLPTFSELQQIFFYICKKADRRSPTRTNQDSYRMLPSIKSDTSCENVDVGFSGQHHDVGRITTEPLVVPIRVVIYIEEHNAPPTKAVF